MAKAYKKAGRVQRANARKEIWDKLSLEEKQALMAQRKALYDSTREPYPAMYQKNSPVVSAQE